MHPLGSRRRARLAAVLVVVSVAAGIGLAILLRPARVPVEDRDVIYFVMVDRFADGQPDAPGTVDRADPQAWHGGDLPGLLAHLDDIEALGAGAVWLTPVTRSRQAPHGPWGAFHGYWVEDLHDIEPRFGTMDDLRALSDALHARGLSLYLDVVYNHVGPDAPLVAQHPDWFHHNGDVVDWDDPVQVVTHDVHGLPDLAQENDAVYAHLADASRGWIDRARPDGFRVDAVRHLAPGFLARLGQDLRAHAPGFELIGEIYDGNVDHVASRAAADQLDAVFDFPLYFAIREGLCGAGTVAQVAAVVNADFGGARPVTLVDNHDLPRIVSVCGGQDRAAVALAVQLTARGRPSLTWGTEIGLEGAEEPANRADMVFGGEPAPIGDTVRELVALRRAWPALRSDTTRVVGLSQQAVLMARIGERDVVTVAVATGELGNEPPRWRGLSGPAESHVVAGAGPLGESGWQPGTVWLERIEARPTVSAGPVRLSVRLTDPPGLGEGDRIVLVGPGELLGGWDPAEGVRLDVDGAFHLAVRDGEVLQFKPVVVHANGATTWDPHPDRFLLVTSDRWTGPGRCGTWCAPVEEGAAAATIRWADPTLVAAVLAGDADGVRAAIAAGADLRVTDEDGRTAAQLAADLGDVDTVEALLDAGTPTSRDLVARAVRTGNPALVVSLVARGLPADAPDERGVTPLMEAAEAGDLAAVRRLLALGADPERADAAGRTARDRAHGPEVRAALGP